MANPPSEGRRVVYTPVEPGSSAPAEQPEWRGYALCALILFAGGVAAGYLGLATQSSGRAGIIALASCTALLVAGFCCSILAHMRMRTWDDRTSGLGLVVYLFPMIFGGLLSLVSALLTLFFASPGGHGRQLKRRARVLLPPLETGAGWGGRDIEVRAAEGLRGPLAAWWRESGRSEHASVAAFARLALELIALGAPAKLIEAASRDAIDEIRHADLCFSIARALDGRSEIPGPFPEARRAGALPTWRPLALASLAVRSLVDGALHEGVSARVMARLAPECEDPAIRDALRELAADEGRHAADGWDIVEWCLAEGGAPVAHALRGAVRSIGAPLRSELPAEARGGSWERHGIQGMSLDAQERACARTDLMRRVKTLTGETLAA